MPTDCPTCSGEEQLVAVTETERLHPDMTAWGVPYVACPDCAEKAGTVTCEWCGRPLFLAAGLGKWRSDLGLVTCFDAPGPYRIHAPLVASSASSERDE